VKKNKEKSYKFKLAYAQDNFFSKYTNIYKLFYT